MDFNHLYQALSTRQSQQLLRHLPTVTPNIDAGIDFYSNDYLGLANSPLLIEALQQYALKQVGSTGSRLLSGNHPLTMRLEQRLANYFHAPKALLFGSGYLANLGLLASIPQRQEAIFYDEYCHACIKEGVRLSHASYYRFAHNNIEDLKNKLQRHGQSRNYIVAEGIYSMQGDQAPIQALLDLCTTHNSCLIIDEAHSTGVCAQGQGLGYQILGEKLKNQENLIRVHTFGKAWGLQGACVVGPEVVINYLINFARSFIYTTALPIVLIVLLHKILDSFEQQLTPVKQLHTQVRWFEQQLTALLPDCTKYKPTHSPIQPLRLGNNQQCQEVASALQQQGCLVRPILSPTVPIGQETLRICLHSFNTQAQLTQLLQALQTCQHVIS